VFNQYTQASKYALPEWRYKNWEWYAQDNWKPTNRLTLDYGVRFYYLSPQWDTTLQASNFLPDQFNQAAAAQLFTPVCVGGAPGAGLRPSWNGPCADCARYYTHAGQYC
jgi:outer membrane receptor protein involved in Fe transport